MTGKRSLVALATLPLVAVSGFGVSSRGSAAVGGSVPANVHVNANVNVALQAPSVGRAAPFSPLFVASASASSNIDELSEGNKKALLSIEKEIEKANRQKEKYLEKVSKFDDISSTLEKKKNDYLDGLALGKVPEGTNFSETTARSAVKALMWRVIAGSVTFVTSLKFSGSIKVALSIVGSDFLSKAATMFIGERLMNKSQAGRQSGADDAGRSLAKALIWRLFAICNTLAAGLLISKDLSVASKIAGSDAIFKTALMFVYERVWAKIEWGKEYNIDFLI